MVPMSLLTLPADALPLALPAALPHGICAVSCGAVWERRYAMGMLITLVGAPLALMLMLS